MRVGRVRYFPKYINGCRVIYKKYMDTVLLLVKGYCSKIVYLIEPCIDK